jgi:uncharacterized membrane protein YcaP (DUF421 family)
MFQEIQELIFWLIGVEKNIAELSIIQVVTRTIIVYGVALGMIRLGKRRFLGGYTAFDILMGFVVGSILSRAITGRENLLSASVVILTLMAIHYVISYFTFYFRSASNIVKNSERQLIKDGEIDEVAMRKSKLGENDLLQALRQKGGIKSPEEVDCAFLERDGTITVIPKKAEPRILEVQVEKGVQTVKIVLSSNIQN